MLGGWDGGEVLISASPCQNRGRPTQTNGIVTDLENRTKYYGRRETRRGGDKLVTTREGQQQQMQQKKNLLLRNLFQLGLPADTAACAGDSQ